MKNNYEKYIEEVWKMKDKAYADFKKSGCAKYTEYLKNELQGTKLPYAKNISTDRIPSHLSNPVSQNR
jgi:hypothetical protein